MGPQHDARTRAFYDHESDEPSPRRRHAAADWGVNEDIFDRMPSRRFARADRRAEHREDSESRRFERRVSGPSRTSDAWVDEAPRGEDHRRDAGAEYAEAADRFAAEYDDGSVSRAPASERRPSRRPAESWTVTDDHVPVEDGKRSIDSWLAPDDHATDGMPEAGGSGPRRPGTGRELAMVPGERRTVVLETAEPEPEVEDTPARRTVTITGHPDRMPVPRAQRPPRTAVERIGASPDRIVGYAVLLGFVLVLIAVLTTGQ
jgi:hypothetical protein